MINFILIKLKNYKGMIPVMIIMTLMSLIFVYIFGIGFSQGYTPKVGIVDLDKSESSKMIIERLKSNKGYEFIDNNFEDSINEVKSSGFIGVILFDKGFDEITFYRSGTSVEQVTLENKINSIIKEALDDQFFTNKLSISLKSVGEDISQEELYKKLSENKKDYVSYINNTSFFQKGMDVKYNALKSSFSGFLLFFSMFTIMFGIGSIVEEKELKVWQRQLVTPLSKKAIITGNLISNFIVSMVQLIIIVLISKILFNFEWGGSTLALILILGAYALAGTGMGLFIAGFVRTNQQLAAILPTVIVSTSMIGGTMWPVEIMQSRILRGLANLLPQRWGMDGLSKILIYNGGIKDVAKPILYLIIIALAFLFAATFTFKKEVKLKKEKLK